MFPAYEFSIVPTEVTDYISIPCHLLIYTSDYVSLPLTNLSIYHLSIYLSIYHLALRSTEVD
jgi:hypothetical protein